MASTEALIVARLAELTFWQVTVLTVCMTRVSGY